MGTGRGRKWLILDAIILVCGINAVIAYEATSGAQNLTAKNPIVASQEEADSLMHMLEDFSNVFRMKSRAGAAFSQIPNRSNLRSSIRIVLNRVWLATTCQYLHHNDFAEALEEVELEKSVIMAELENVTVAYLNPHGNISLSRDDTEIEEFKASLESAAKEMRRVQETGLCNNVTANEMINIFELAMKEIMFQKSAIDGALKALDVQKQATSAALEGMEAEKKEAVGAMETLTKAALESMQSVRKETLEAMKSEKAVAHQALEAQKAKVLEAFEAQKTQVLAAVESVKKETVEASRDYKNASEAALGAMQGIFEGIKSRSDHALESMESQRKQVFQAMDSQKNLTTIALQAVARQSNLTQSAMATALEQTEAHAKQRDQLAKMEEYLLPLIGDPLPGWIQSIQAKRTDHLARFATNPITAALVANHIQTLVTSAYSNNTYNLDAVLSFVEKLPDKKLSLLAYQSLFASMDHSSNWWGSVRLVHKLMIMSEKYNESATSFKEDEPSFRNFLHANVHPDFLRIMAGEFFNLESHYYRNEYTYLGQFAPTSNILYNAATLRVTPAGRLHERWLWQLLPIPGDDGNRFFLRSKAHVTKPLRLVDADYIRIEPHVPIVRTPGAGGVHPPQIIVYIRRVLSGTYHYPSQQQNTDRRFVGRDILASAGRSDIKKWTIVFPSGR